MSSAYVFIEKNLVGELLYKNGEIQLVYDKKWLSTGFAISYSLPLNGDYKARTSHQFFSNLLPEGNLRDLICRKLKISPDNDWDLLLCLGKESAGALTVTTDPDSSLNKADYKKLSSKDLDEFSKTKTVLPQIISSEATRLSLAGAQDKLALYFDGSNYFLPINGAPTNVILKFENDDYQQITVNEVFITQLASLLNLQTSQCRLYTSSKRPIAIFDRYDRMATANGLRRIHQEDSCQALGRSQKIKYQKEGGPSFVEVLELISEVSFDPLADRQALIKWQIFNILCGNSDGHGKNISFFRNSDEICLTPFYDLVCTRVFQKLDRHLAMSYGGTYDPDVLEIVHIEKWAKEISVSKKYLRDEIIKIAESINSILPNFEKEFITKYNNYGLLEQISLFIKKKVRGQLKKL